MFISMLQLWLCSKLMKLLLDPLSQFDSRTIKSHNNFANNSIKFSQDYLYSIHT